MPEKSNWDTSKKEKAEHKRFLVFNLFVIRDQPCTCTFVRNGLALLRAWLKRGRTRDENESRLLRNTNLLFFFLTFVDFET
ncbi:hypothetical protein QQP08_005545 [Theobroma cacao]|nr:hypothetical protein QQP08_005545 [Theobroma cacao]